MAYQLRYAQEEFNPITFSLGVYRPMGHWYRICWSEINEQIEKVVHLGGINYERRKSDYGGCVTVEAENETIAKRLARDKLSLDIRERIAGAPFNRDNEKLIFLKEYEFYHNIIYTKEPTVTLI